MNFQQLRYVRETVRQGLNLTEAARKLYTSQPGVSKQIRELETELGVEIFVRHGKRIVAVTEPGKAVVDVIEQLLQEAENLKQVGQEFKDQTSGTLTLGTTHTQARYSLPKVVSEFKRRYPKVHLILKQGSPQQLAEMVIAREADIAIATEALDGYPKLIALPGYEWSHSVVVPARHPLAKGERLTLEELARHPIVTYDAAFAGRSHIDAAFGAQGLAPDIVLSAVDSDVIKTYVELGLGVGIIAAMAFDAKRDRSLRALDAGHLFGTMTTRVAVRRGAALRGYAYTFIELFSPRLNRRLVETAFAGKAEAYEL
ncbi:MAG TPA: CysB family HTH-type transcriptional regulator [Burkholderiales bacterium]|nr:CysB family HTH-type transcriptional regulator [Burkholderiales bacterium]HYA46175.1 CysB family HTH-type transcriptional regulator [Burkholderiales bacterium]